MSYKDVNGRNIAPSLNPYVNSGAASSVAGESYPFHIVKTDTIATLIQDVQRTLNTNKSIRIFFVGDIGYGKTTQINLIADEFAKINGMCLPIKFQELVALIPRAGEPDEILERLHGAILEKIAKLMIDQGVIVKEDYIRVAESAEYIDYFEVLFKLLLSSQKAYILIIFDEIEILFSKLEIRMSDFMGLMHSISEKLFRRPKWGICISITEEHYREIYEEARQLQEGRFEFKVLKPLSLPEVVKYIEEKNSLITRRISDKLYPFDEETARFIASVSNGVPRYIETVSELIWSKAETTSELINLEIARRIVGNAYQVYASRYFSDFCQSFRLIPETECLLNLLFFSGGKNQSVKQLVSLGELCPSPTVQNTFFGYTEQQVEYKLRKAVQNILDNRRMLQQQLIITDGRPRLCSLKDAVYKTVFNNRARI